MVDRKRPNTGITGISILFGFLDIRFFLVSSTRFGTCHQARLVRMCWIASKTSTWNKQFKQQKKKDDQTNLNNEGVFQRWNVFCSLWLTIKWNGVFGLVCTENRRRRLRASKNDWTRACMSFWTLPIPTSCKLKF